MRAFELIDATSAEHAAQLLRQHGSVAQAIARGGDLLGLLKEDVFGPSGRAPSVLVNLASACDLRRIVDGPQGLQLGTMCTLAQLQQMPGLPSMLHDAIAHIASPQLRAWTTLGGNLLQRPRCLYFRHPDIACFKKGGQGCPAVHGPTEAYPGSLIPGACNAAHPSDLAPVLIALQAQALVVGAEGMRRIPLNDLYSGAEANPDSETVLAHDEVLTALLLPTPPANVRQTQAFYKAAPRAANEFAWASAAVVLEGDGVEISNARIALGGIAPRPWMLAEASTLTGQRAEAVEPSTIAQALLPQAPAGIFATRLPAARLALSQALESALRRFSEQPRT